MTACSEPRDGLYLNSLNPGAVIDVETKGRHYRIEYVGGDEIRISGHPFWCPTPVRAHLQGSTSNSVSFQAGFVGRGMHLMFQRFDESIPVTTTAVKDFRIEHS